MEFQSGDCLDGVDGLRDELHSRGDVRAGVVRLAPRRDEPRKLGEGPGDRVGQELGPGDEVRAVVARVGLGLGRHRVPVVDRRAVGDDPGAVDRLAPRIQRVVVVVPRDVGPVEEVLDARGRVGLREVAGPVRGVVDVRILRNGGHGPAQDRPVVRERVPTGSRRRRCPRWRTPRPCPSRWESWSRCSGRTPGRRRSRPSRSRPSSPRRARAVRSAGCGGGPSRRTASR